MGQICLNIPFTTYFPSGALFLDLEGLRAAHESQKLQYFVT
jgi:hypothetical protein